CFIGWKFLQQKVSFPKPPETLFRSLQGVIAEIEGAPVVSLKDEETDGHRGIGLLQQGVRSGEHFRQPDLVIVAFPHLLAVERNHIVVQPIPRRHMFVGDSALRNLAFMMRELEIHAAAVDVELLAEVFRAHSRAFYMPAREAFTPRALPAHNVFRRGGFPQREVLAVVFLFLALEIARRFQQIVQDTAAEFSVRVLRRIFLYVEVDRSIYLIGKSRIDDLFDHADLFHDVTGCGRLDARIEVIELVHGPMEQVGIFLHKLHRLQLFDNGLFGDLVLGFASFFFEMPGVGDVPHITDLITQMEQITVNKIKGDKGAGVTQVAFAADRRAAYIHADMSGRKWDKYLFLPG